MPLNLLKIFSLVARILLFLFGELVELSKNPACSLRLVGGYKEKSTLPYVNKRRKTRDEGPPVMRANVPPVVHRWVLSKNEKYPEQRNLGLNAKHITMDKERIENAEELGASWTEMTRKG